MTEKRFVTPDLVSTNFHLRSGDKVADLGAGTGFFLPVLSRLVGNSGRVYAVEIQKNLVGKLADKIQREGLGNTEAVWGDIEELDGTKIQDESLDAAILVNTFFQTENREETIKEARRILRDGGKLLIVDWSESWSGLGPQPGDVISESETKTICESQAFTFERNFDAGDHHYGLGFRK